MLFQTALSLHPTYFIIYLQKEMHTLIPINKIQADSFLIVKLYTMFKKEDPENIACSQILYFSLQSPSRARDINRGGFIYRQRKGVG